MKRISDEELFNLFRYPSKEPNVNYELKPYENHPDMASFTVIEIARQSAQAQLEACEKEAQEKVKEIKQGIERLFAQDPKLMEIYIIPRTHWQAFWQGYLED